MQLLKELDWIGIRRLYDRRKAAHRLALTLRASKNRQAFAELVLGISEPAGNFSASRHALGQRVLTFNHDPAARIHKVAAQFARLKTADAVPAIIRSAGLQYFQISVGSETSCIVNPKVCWVANRRTIWAHVLLQHGWNVSTANEALALYCDDDVDSEMHYSNWTALHQELASSMPKLVTLGSEAARQSGVSAGTLTFLWGDVVADGLYEEFHE